MKFPKSISWLLLCILSLGWFFWSFILTDRSLLYSSSTLFLNFQNFFWQFADARLLQTGIYTALVISLFIGYLYLSRRQKPITLSHVVIPLTLFYLLFTLSNPALSYDLFNYMFDAKLIIHYHLDPHLVSAIAFEHSDDWVRFMRNTFFPTTYGYVWTLLSLIPYMFGVGKLLLTFISFKLFMLCGLILLFFVQRFIFLKDRLSSSKNALSSLALFFFCPLVVIESLSSGHNDVWMMVLAFVSLALLVPSNTFFGIARQKWTLKKLVLLGLRVCLSFALLYASTQVKRSTVLLLPTWGLFLTGIMLNVLSVKENIRRICVRLGYWWADMSAVLLFIPLFSGLSRQFHPWYLIWSLSFLPFVKSRILKIFLISFSLTSQLRYIPVLYMGQYSNSIELVQKAITWSAIPIGLLVWCIFAVRERMK